ncbi:MAG: class I SAM-dependent methyltransferase [Myxococcota bacterium]|nr:class I SAM-dependent methyltransferase [Myxococcota bacterium]
MSDILLTGERLQPGSQLFGVDLARHRAAYVYANRNARGTRLLDLGCGTGYGTAELADSVGSKIAIFGLDRVPPSNSSRRENTNFVRADLAGIPLADASFSTIASFQVIEHLEDPGPYLAAIARLLEPEGSAYLTTPNRLTSDGVNPWHVHEYEAEELRRTLSTHFDEVEMLGVGIGPAVVDYFDARLERIRRIMRIDPLGLHKMLPQSLLDWLFARFAVLVRRGIDEDDGIPDATVGDFPIGPATPGDIDLLAVCRRPRATS